jgi:hypothetical protein
MGLLADLESGSCGVRFSVPAPFQLETEDAAYAALWHRERKALGLFLLRSPYRLDLRREHHELLERDVARLARELFETVTLTANRKRPQPGGMRTDDPRWSPVISVDRVRIGGFEALTVIHRMRYEPGREHVMGHVLIPVRCGLVELRVIAGSQLTGVRESSLVDRALAQSPDADPLEVVKRLDQSHFDDARYDPEFPDHPLTLVRSELRRLVDPSVVEVTAPAPTLSVGEVPLPNVACAITPPRRYVLADSKGALFSRVALATTSEVQLISISRLAQDPSDPDIRAPSRARQAYVLRLAAAYAQAAVRNAVVRSDVELRALPERRGRAEAAAFVEFSFDRSAPRNQRRNVILSFMDPRGGTVFVVAAASCCVPREELLEEVDAVAASWRPI